MESNRVKLKYADMYFVFTTTIDNGVSTRWQQNGHKLADSVLSLLAECENGYTVLDSFEIEFESVEDAVLFKMLYNE